MPPLPTLLPYGAGNYEMPFETYLKYMKGNHDEMPLYLFDKTFCHTAPQLASDFHVPPYFTDDLFSVLEEDRRPDYRYSIPFVMHLFNISTIS